MVKKSLGKWTRGHGGKGGKRDKKIPEKKKGRIETTSKLLTLLSEGLEDVKRP